MGSVARSPYLIIVVSIDFLMIHVHRIQNSIEGRGLV